MKKVISVFLVLGLCIGVLSGCGNKEKAEEPVSTVVSPLPETIDINNLKDCTVAVSLEKGDVYIDDGDKMQMDVKVYTYELYDMVDIASLKEGDTIIRRGEEIKIDELERLDTGLININGGEENGGFSLFSKDSTVYYEIGMSDIKAYYELGDVTLPVSEKFVYSDESDLEAEAKLYYASDFMTEDENIEYNFNPNNTSITIIDGEVIEMVKIFLP